MRASLLLYARYAAGFSKQLQRLAQINKPDPTAGLAYAVDDRLEAERAQTREVVRPTLTLPAEPSICLGNANVVDARLTPAHQPLR